ncbi:TetR/AcrR family transcriptional regulator [Raineyella sp. LH-20]|uniref:TetR/AcrR family transcriptional regulator n=1 Tax=Raineyella sp. LH-20 TaxID=3081204 RepID=UPI0029531DA7|nr:TetR family transcriptional regulator [Raineyella sp. LH-20]WOP17437.1 TetR family transcriptional regulator [Raineyella sp. LH-20]
MATTPTLPAPERADGPKRADARRNIEAILEAATDCLSMDPDASVAAIARAAGVGRVTLYGHFAGRADLVDATVARAIERGDAVLAAVDLDGDPTEALVRLIRQSWSQIVRIGALMTVASATLSPERMLELHRRPASRVEGLIERGRTAGVFRADLPVSWLVGTLHRVMHGAAEEIAAGRLDADAAGWTIAATVVAAFTPPGRPVPRIDRR